MNNKIKQDAWLNKLHDKISNYEEPVELSDWEKLEKELASVHSHRSFIYNKTFISIAASILILMGLSTIFHFAYSPLNERANIKRQITKKENTFTLPSRRRTYIHQNVPVSSSNMLCRIKHKPKDISILARKKEEPTIHSSDVAAVLSNSDSTNIKNKRNNSDIQQSLSRKKKYHIRQHNNEYDDRLIISRNRHSWSFAMSVGTSGGTLPTAYNSTEQSDIPTLSAASQKVYSVPYTISTSDYKNYSFKHHQPLSFGLSLRKILSTHFSIESGLVYTLLISDIELPYETNQKSQKLYYIGIPIKYNWTFISEKQFQLYLTGGGMIEKCIYARLGEEHLKVDAIQFSIGGGGGIEYKINPHLGIYGETGVIYFFNDNSCIQTIRKKSPCNVNLQVGLRITY